MSAAILTERSNLSKTFKFKSQTFTKHHRGRKFPSWIPVNMLLFRFFVYLWDIFCLQNTAWTELITEIDIGLKSVEKAFQKSEMVMSEILSATHEKSVGQIT